MLVHIHHFLMKPLCPESFIGPSSSLLSALTGSDFPGFQTRVFHCPVMSGIGCGICYIYKACVLSLSYGHHATVYHILGLSAVVWFANQMEDQYGKQLHMDDSLKGQTAHGLGFRWTLCEGLFWLHKASSSGGSRHTDRVGMLTVDNYWVTSLGW